jgi:uncharacterized membrane protein YkvA (DUF1232 family)
MPLTVSFQLSDRDLKYFRELMRETKEGAAVRDDVQICEAAGKLLNEMKAVELPDFVRERMEKLDTLCHMVQDNEWRLEGGDRDHVMHAMAYLADPADAIPDQIPGLGFLDDAIMVELVCQDLRHEIEAYSDFCVYRKSEEKRRGNAGGAATREQWLTARRTQLQERMRRRRHSLWESRLGRSLW